MGKVNFSLLQPSPTCSITRFSLFVLPTRSDALALVWGRCKDAFGQAWGLCEAQAGPPPSHDDMKGDMEIGAKHGWKYTWAVEDTPTVYCYGAVRGRRRYHGRISSQIVVVVCVKGVAYVVTVRRANVVRAKKERIESLSSLLILSTSLCTLTPRTPTAALPA